MKTAIRWLTGAVLASLLVLGFAGRAQAQDPVAVAPQHYQVLMDDDNVRLLHFHLRPGEQVPMHSHPAHFTYALTNYELKIDSANGYPSVVARNPGDLKCAGPGQHTIENVGQTDAMALILEIKEPPLPEDVIIIDRPLLRLFPRFREVVVVERREKPHHLMLAPNDLKWTDKTPGLPAGGKMAILEGDPNKPGPFTFRFRAPAGFKVMPHSHPGTEHVTVLSGVVHMGMGDAFDKSKAKKLTAGSFAVMPAGGNHFVWVEEEAIVQIHGVGPWGITYVNPADDPRKK